ncbi:protein-S-isoprenylcysteine O-methyltransferase Ste14 [Streptomyces griseochromogenes]|uniref:Isoprenylcysteine carboxyl methyltransferase n=1 Tax=Streptomyces griseochromogenes TaxID=68214 RepID=A0A1B1AXC6_9ACTN|nr:isoprenylcysteine carboxylmethyltransferase family protein [Streptomyces griseochromogenes]ANP51187.1 isoprenylcysteine carboxyl methyltransferase [Streptomyces griseochromogenes]MBP2050139.1 protein-S-isoprenylcysteine O-methyltransferase Ste14 [Streptomyces griseochromogenes]
MRKASAALGTALFLVLVSGGAAVLVPWSLTDGWRTGDWWLPLRLLGLVPLAAGAAVILEAYARFALEGLGTPAPIAPPARLVVSGPYRYVRNPIYVAVVAVLAGQGLLLARPVLFVYAAGAWALSWAFVRWYEEPGLVRRFGAEYERYRRAVPAWRPRRTPWRDT